MKSLARFKNIHRGEACVVIGNGPSLKEEDVNVLAAKYPTFGSNQIYRLPFTPTYYVMVDEDMTRASLPLPDEFNPRELFVRAEAGVGNPIYPIVVAGFSVDFPNFVVMGGTVTYAILQIAFYMGFETMLLVGVDHRYPKAGQMLPGSSFVASGDDPDHFVCADGEPYFREDAIYNAPELEGTTQSYAIAKQLFDQSGRRVINLTPRTNLDVFEKDSIDNWI